MTYSQFQNAPVSEKLTLAIMYASKRLMVWELHSGSVYKLTGFDVQSISSIEDSGTAYTEATSVSGVTASKFYNDRDNKILYLRDSDSSNPNSRFLVLTQRLFFSSAPVVLPYDLAAGYEVYWEPMIKSTSQFGVEIDTISQTSDAIEGSGTLTLFNDSAFWPANYDKLIFENNDVYIYSHNRDLDPSEAKLIYKGKVEKKAYKPDSVQFSLKDILRQLRAPLDLANIEDLGSRTDPSLLKAKQRMVFGRVFGHKLVNMNAARDGGYAITGLINLSNSTTTVTGVLTLFLAELSPGDQLVINGSKYSIGSITSDTSLELSDIYTGSSIYHEVPYVIPDQPKRYMNRIWFIAAHALRQPTTACLDGSTINSIFVESTKDMYAGDDVVIAGTVARISEVVSSQQIRLSRSLISSPAEGALVFKPAVQHLRINDIELVYGADYSVNQVQGTLTLTETAEANRSPILQTQTNLTFTDGSQTVTGTGLQALKPGYIVWSSAHGYSNAREVLSVDSDTQLTLRLGYPVAGGGTLTAKANYKPLIFNPESHTLSCDVMGRTDDGLYTGNLVSTAPGIVKLLLQDAGLNSQIDETSFDDAEDIAYQEIGLAVPTKVDDTDTPTYRDVINKINQSVLGSLVQTNAFNLSYVVLQPRKEVAALRLSEPDILSFTMTSTAEKVIKTAIVEYLPKEYDYLAKKDSIVTAQKTSDVSTYLLKTTTERTFPTVLVKQQDAEILANRWSFILEYAAGTVSLQTKLQSINLEVGDIIDISHRKFFERYGSNDTRMICLVESIKKSGTGVAIQAVDLSAAFNRVANITDNPTVWSESDTDTRLYGGYITDVYGMQDNDSNTFGLNLLW
jgi:hypothetical protein